MQTTSVRFLRFDRLSFLFHRPDLWSPSCHFAPNVNETLKWLSSRHEVSRREKINLKVGKNWRKKIKEVILSLEKRFYPGKSHVLCCHIKLAFLLFFVAVFCFCFVLFFKRFMCADHSRSKHGSERQCTWKYGWLFTHDVRWRVSAFRRTTPTSLSHRSDFG